MNNGRLSEFFVKERHGSVTWYIAKKPPFMGYLVSTMLQTFREIRECNAFPTRVGEGKRPKRKRKPFRERIKERAKKVLKKEIYNLDYRNARRIVKYINLYYSREYLADLVRLFDLYLSAYEDKYVVLRNEVNNDYLVMKVDNRFTDITYFKKVAREFRKLYKLYRKYHGYGLFITITVDPSQFQSTMEMVVAVKLFLDYLRRLIYDVWKYQYLLFKTPKRKGSFIYEAIVNRKLRVTKLKPKYVCVLEFTDSYIPHLHILWFGVKFLYKPFLTELMKAKGIGICCWIEKFQLSKVNEFIDDLQNDGDKPLRKRSYTIVDYILKYLGKVVDQDSYDDLDLLYSKYALYWATNSKFFSSSRGLIKLNHHVPNGVWKYVISFHLDDEHLPLPLENFELKAYYSYDDDLDYHLFEEFINALREYYEL